MSLRDSIEHADERLVTVLQTEHIGDSHDFDDFVTKFFFGESRQDRAYIALNERIWR